MSKDTRPIEVGDQFQDLDKRSPGARVVKVISLYENGLYAEVENVEHWNETLIGRSTVISVMRLGYADRFKRISR